MVGRVCLVGPETLQKRSRGYLPRLPALRMCGGDGKHVDDGLVRVVGTKPTEADGDEDARGNRRAKFAVAGLTRPTS